MFINQTVTKELYNEAGDARLSRAKTYVAQKRVNIQTIYYENMNNFSVTSLVDGNYDEYRVCIEVKNGELETLTWECEDYHTPYRAC